MSLRELEMAIELFKQKVWNEIKLLLKDNKILITSFELSHEIYGCRIDGITCVTFRDFINNLEEKFYNKNGKIRREVRVSQPLSLKTVLALMRGGIEGSITFSQIVQIAEEVTKLRKCIQLMVNEIRTNRELLLQRIDIEITKNTKRMGRLLFSLLY